MAPRLGELHGGIRPVAGNRVMRPLGMIDLLRMHGPNHRELIHVTRGLGEQLRNLNPGHIGGDRPEGAVRLRIPGIDVAGAALQPQQDHGLSLGFALVQVARTADY